MIKIILLCIIPFFVFAADLWGPSGGFGAGIMLGEPTGISLKSWLTKNNAWDAGIAWGMGKDGALHLHGDYLWHKYDFIKVEKGRLPLYYGVGARVLFADDARIGIRGVIGLDYIFARTPLDIFLEIAPVFDIVPGTDLSVNGALGIRYFF